MTTTAPLPTRTKGKPLCGCCFGAGSVLDCNGERRPCSRCSPDAFSRWYERHRAPHATATPTRSR